MARPGQALVQGDEVAVYADKAYDSEKFRDALAEAGITDGVMHEARRNIPLKDWQRWFNKAVSPIPDIFRPEIRPSALIPVTPNML